MRFMLLQNYGGVESDCAPMYEWSPDEVRAHIEFQLALNRRLEELGELIDAQGLAGPDDARFVVSDGTSAPLVTDGPFPESKELLAGYRVVEVDTPERAVGNRGGDLGRTGPRGGRPSASASRCARS